MIGQTIGGKYTVVRRLGEGGMGAVYEARHTGTGRRVAVKVITGGMAADPKLLARFEIEARAAGAIESEHIVQVLDVGQDGPEGAPFLAMEYLEGEDLQQLFKRLGAVPADLGLRLGVQACLGLEKAHAQGIVHRDIKPANLFLTERDGGEIRLKLLDFGIAKVAPGELGTAEKKAPLTKMGMLLGSPLYMSPEQARGRGELDHRTDIWSLGIVLYQALAGRTPFDHVGSVGDFVMAVCTVPVTPLRACAAWVDPAVAAAVERALHLDPGQRYQSATEMREALSAFLPQGFSIRASMLISAPAATAPMPVTMPASPVGATDELGSGAAQSPAGGPPAGWHVTVPAQPSDAGLAVAAPALAAPVVVTPAPAPAPSLPAPIPPASGRTGLILAGLLTAAVGGIGLAFALGWVGAKPRPHGVTPAAAEAARAAALAPLLGTWWGDGGQSYDAVHVNDTVIFRLRDPEHLAAQGYVAGDPHFVLRAVDGDAAAFRVESRARPLPPRGTTYDLVHAHATCVASWNEIGGRPLRAELAGERLTVKLARAEATPAMFTREGSRVMGCAGLGEAHVVEADVVLGRQPLASPGIHPGGAVQDAGAHEPGDAGVHEGPKPVPHHGP